MLTKKVSFDSVVLSPFTFTVNVVLELPVRIVCPVRLFRT